MPKEDRPNRIGDHVVLDGDVLPVGEARISVLDRGLLRGEGVFETVRTYGGVPFAVGRHLARMHKSAAAAGIRLPDDEVLRASILLVCEANGFAETRVHLTVTGGPGGPAPDPMGDVSPTTIALAGEVVDPDGVGEVTAVTLPWDRHQGAALTGVKPTSYLDHLIGHKWAHQQGADEGLWRNGDGDVTEATGSNLFAVVDGAVVTPPVEAGLLPGVTRDLVLERCRARGVPAREHTLHLEDVYGAQELFLTSTTKEAVAVTSVDGRDVGDGSHPVTDAVVADWRSWAPRHTEP